MVAGGKKPAGNGVDLLIWDWNGTLLDDTRLCYDIANQMRIERGMPPLESVDAYRGLFRFPVKEYYKDMGYTFETESYEDISVEFVDLYAKLVHTCPLQPQAEAVLAAVQSKGVPQILLSATGADRLYSQAAMFGLPTYFTQVVGCENNLAHGKADKAKALLQNQGVSPERTLFIGDTDHDFQIAKELGCQCLLLESGHQLPHHLRSLGAATIASLQEVLPYLS